MPQYKKAKLTFASYDVKRSREPCFAMLIVMAAVNKSSQAILEGLVDQAAFTPLTHISNQLLPEMVLAGKPWIGSVRGKSRARQSRITYVQKTVSQFTGLLDRR